MLVSRAGISTGPKLQIFVGIFVTAKGQFNDSSRTRDIAQVFWEKFAKRESGKNQCDRLGQKVPVEDRIELKKSQNLFDSFWHRHRKARSKWFG